MDETDPLNFERIDREIRINEMKHRAEELAGGEMMSFEAEDIPAPIAEGFWGHVLAYEEAPLSCNFIQLQEAGVDLPEPDVLDDEALTAKLWEVIEALARMRAFLERTDHLSDRELYAHLWHESLREIHPCMPMDENSAWNIDILGGCSTEDLHLSLKYYEDEEGRRRWAESFPEDIIPPHEDPPYDRDRFLPKAEYGRG